MESLGVADMRSAEIGAIGRCSTFATRRRRGWRAAESAVIRTTAALVVPESRSTASAATGSTPWPEIRTMQAWSSLCGQTGPTCFRGGEGVLNMVSSERGPRRARFWPAGVGNGPVIRKDTLGSGFAPEQARAAKKKKAAIYAAFGNFSDATGVAIGTAAW